MWGNRTNPRQVPVVPVVGVAPVAQPVQPVTVVQPTVIVDDRRGASGVGMFFCNLFVIFFVAEWWEWWGDGWEYWGQWEEVQDNKNHEGGKTKQENSSFQLFLLKTSSSVLPHQIERACNDVGRGIGAGIRGFLGGRREPSPPRMVRGFFFLVLLVCINMSVKRVP